MSATLLPPAPAPVAPAPVPGRSRTRLVALKVLLAVAVVLIAASCTGRHPVPGSYGKPLSSVEKNFVKGCVSTIGAGTVAENTKICQCTYVNVKATIPFTKFKEINSELSKKPAALPVEFQKIVAGCLSSDGRTTSTTLA